MTGFYYVIMGNYSKQSHLKTQNRNLNESLDILGIVLQKVKGLKGKHEILGVGVVLKKQETGRFI